MPVDRLLHPRLGHSQKINALNHLEYRVWHAYQLAADDFGVMRCTAITVQNTMECLADEPRPVIEQALNRLIELQLVIAFTHQGRRYVCQRDWQDFQKVKHPRTSIQPCPPPEVLEQLTDMTLELFRNFSETFPKNFQRVSEKFRASRARARAKRLTANGKRLTANGSEGEGGEEKLPDELSGRNQGAKAHAQVTPPYEAFRQAYPAARRVGGDAAEKAFAKALAKVSLEAMLEALEQHKRAEQWQDPALIPLMTTWLNQERWNQVLPPARASPEKQLAPRTQALSWRTRQLQGEPR